MVCVRPDDLVSHIFLRLSLSTQRAIPLLIDHHTVASTGGLEPVRTLNETVAIQPPPLSKTVILAVFLLFGLT